MAGNKRKVQEVNAGSMADIAFLLLIFFLVVTTMASDYGLQRVLPPWQEDQTPAQDVKERNLYLVYINSSNKIMAGGEYVEIWQIKDLAKEFVLNPTNSPTRPEILMKEVDLIGTIPVSEGIVSLQSDRGTNYETYIAVQNELTRAFNELREEASMKYFGKPMKALSKQQNFAITSAGGAVPMKISEAEPRKTF